METWLRALADIAYAVVAAGGVIGLSLLVLVLAGVVVLVTTAVRRRRSR